MVESRVHATVQRTSRVHGTGYHSGQQVTVEFRPAQPGRGIVFVRDDISGSPSVPALVAHRVDADRRTVLAVGDVRVAMVEHVLAAVAGLGITDCEIGVTGEEMPGLDGSSLGFVEAIETAGLQSFPIPVATLVPEEVVRVGDADAWVEAHPSTEPGLSLQYELDYGQAGPLGPQTVCMQVTPQTFAADLASSRTFLLEEEANALRAMGIGHHVTPRELLILGDDGPIDNEYRFDDECARHKVLDMVGDLALLGMCLQAHVVAHRSGHRLNAALVMALLKHQDEMTGAIPTDSPQHSCVPA